MATHTDPRRILFVCTANICRSPTAELLARRRFGESAHLFRSAGFLESDRTVPDDLSKVLEKEGIVADDHRSSRLDQDTLAAAELILTMEGRHVQNLTIEYGPALEKAIPLREAADRLASEATTIEEFLISIKDRDPASYLGTQWDVDDPYKRGKRRYKKMVDEVDGLVATVIGSLR